MSDAWRIAPAGRAERAAVIELLAAQLAEHDIALPTASLASAVDGVLEVPARGILLLAHLGEAPVGAAYLAYTWTLEHGGRVAWLEELYVRPEHRSQGIGGDLLTAVLAHARAAGCAAIDLEVESSHARAAGLYIRRGFRQLGRTRFSLQLG